jgi:hypothetical protein
MPDPFYRMLRQQVVAQLPRGAQARDVLQLIAHAAICGSAQAAQLDLITAGGEPRNLEVIDEVLAWVEGHFAGAPGSGPGPRVLCAASQWTSASKTRTSRGSSSTRISATNPRNFRRSRADWPASGSS